ncbi:hypothetical protein ABT063_42995 [Streptomyces sp. NPDC002838]|uniref:hypothetical protein n=1 Tax=Streptomyces sp. NPDC002838 TaxID=3154436 RepID=UPI0033229CA0
MASVADAGSRSGAGTCGPPLRGARTNVHLAWVTVVAVAVLIATQCVACQATAASESHGTAHTVSGADRLTDGSRHTEREK